MMEKFMKLIKQTATLGLLCSLLLTVSCSQKKDNGVTGEKKAEKKQESKENKVQSNEAAQKSQDIADEIMLMQQEQMEVMNAEINEQITDSVNVIVNKDFSDDLADSTSKLGALMDEQYEQRDNQFQAKFEARMVQKLPNSKLMTQEEMLTKVKIQAIQINITKKLNEELTNDITAMKIDLDGKLALAAERKMQELEQRRMDAIIDSAFEDRERVGQISEKTEAMITELTTAEVAKKVVQSTDVRTKIISVVLEAQSPGLDTEDPKSRVNMVKSLEIQAMKKVEHMSCENSGECPVSSDK
jgi:hypothetical protein